MCFAASLSGNVGIKACSFGGGCSVNLRSMKAARMQINKSLSFYNAPQAEKGDKRLGHWGKPTVWKQGFSICDSLSNHSNLETGE